MTSPPTIDEIRSAAERGREVVVATPLVPLHSADGSDDILLKPEVHQVVGSFKIRGIFHHVSSPSAPPPQTKSELTDSSL